jgi:hypothetical protein
LQLRSDAININEIAGDEQPCHKKHPEPSQPPFPPTARLPWDLQSRDSKWMSGSAKAGTTNREAHVRAAGSEDVRSCALLRSARQETVFSLDNDLDGSRNPVDVDPPIVLKAYPLTLVEP